MKHLNKISTLIAAGGLCVAAAVPASELTTDNPHFGEKGWDVSLGVGVFSASDAIYQFEDDDYEEGVYLPLDVIWYGEKFHFALGEDEGLLFGYTLAKTSRWALDAIAGPRGGGPDSDDLKDEFDDIDERDIDFQAGLRYTIYGKDDLIKLELTRDIADVHDGYLATGSYQKEWQLKNWVLTGGAALAYVSEDMTGYYFDISESEQTPQVPVYSAGASTIVAASLSAEYPINEDWVFETELAHFWLDDEITDSPISTDDDSISAISTAVIYHF